MQRRREHRYEVWESVTLSVLSGSANGQTRAATVVDISRSGYRILSGLNLEVGTEVLITLNSVAIFGTLRHCESADMDAFTSGVQITRVVPEVQPAIVDSVLPVPAFEAGQVWPEPV